jgi:protein O-mannosyl-transferase
MRKRAPRADERNEIAKLRSTWVETNKRIHIRNASSRPTEKKIFPPPGTGAWISAVAKSVKDTALTPRHRVDFSQWVSAALLCAAVVIAYLNSFSGPLVFDDTGAIRSNPSIRDLSNLGAVLSPPNDSGTTVNGRPILNLSLALNYAVHGERVTGYHIANLAIHLAATLAFLGTARRLFARIPEKEGRPQRADFTAFCATILWALHPLQTQSVTYIVQRAEALVGLFILCCLQGFLRSHESSRPRVWLSVSVLFALLAVATKEVSAGLPLLVLLCDRAFFSGSFAEAWRRRRIYHLALFATWIPLGLQIAAAGGRGGTVGFGLTDVTAWSYLLTQGDAITRYLWLAVWPARLVFDYGTGVVGNLTEVWPQILLVLGLLAATVAALVRAPRLGFVGSWFFIILAPSSSFVPIVTETMAEHRMYLPLATVTTLAALGMARLPKAMGLMITAAASCALGALTWQRNAEYTSEETLWATSVARYPRSARAHNNYGESLTRRRADAEAIHHYTEAVRLQPGYLDALCNLGGILHRSGRIGEGRGILEHVLAENPRYVPALSTYGACLFREGRFDQAKDTLGRAIALRPDYADALNNLGVVLNDCGNPAEALPLFQRTIEINPLHADGWYNHGSALARLGRLNEAAGSYTRCLELDHGRAEALNNLGVIALSQGRSAEALAHFERAMAVAPQYADPVNNAGVVLSNGGENDRARKLFERALVLRPGYPDAERNLRMLDESRGR